MFRSTQQMFGESTIQIISSLRFDPSAETVSCVIPLGSIFWTDELPRMRFLDFSRSDRDAIMRLFALRINYWDTGVIGDEDKPVWDQAQAQFPDWPFFRRLELTPAQRLEHKDTQRQLENLFDELATLGVDLTISEGANGFSAFSATFNVADE